MSNEKTNQHLMQLKASISPHKRREHVVAMRKAGDSLVEIQAKTGLSRRSVFRILRDFKINHDSCFDEKIKGRPVGAGRILNEEQEQEVFQRLFANPPRVAGEGAEMLLWDSDDLRRVIFEEAGVQLPTSTMKDYLRRWGFPKSTKPPLSLFRKSHPSKPNIHGDYIWTAIKNFQNEGKQCCQNVLWLYQAEVILDMPTAFGQAECLQRGCTKILLAINNRGEYSFKLFQGNITSKNYEDFLTALSKDIKTRTLLVHLDETTTTDSLAKHGRTRDPKIILKSFDECLKAAKEIKKAEKECADNAYEKKADKGYKDKVDKGDSEII